MIYPFFASFIIIIAVLTYKRKKASMANEKTEEAFWKREAEANLVTRKPLDDLDYINIPFETLPMDVLTDDPKVADCIRMIKTYADKKTVNLTGFTNTDLKLQYGTLNLHLLTEYDANFTRLVSTLNTWALCLKEHDYHNEAIAVLEYAVSIRSDVSGTYRELSAYYAAAGDKEKITRLITIAEGLNSLMKNSIIKDLREKLVNSTT